MTVAELIEKLKDEAWSFGKGLEAEVYAMDCDGDGQTPRVETCLCTRDDKPYKAIMIYGEED